MRELTNDEKIYVSSLLKSEKTAKRFFGIILLIIPAFSLYADNVDKISLVLYGTLGILGLVLLITSFTGNANCGITGITGSYSKKFSRGSRGRHRILYFLGETRVNIPSAWLSSLELKKEYTAEIYSREKGVFAFTPIVLSISGLREDLASISLSEMKTEERKIVKEAFRSFSFYSLAIGIPFFLIILFFRLITNSDKVLVFLNEHSDVIMIFIDYISTHSIAGSLAAFIFKYGYIFIILMSLIIAALIRAKKTGKVSKQQQEEILSRSWNTWLRDYADFMENEFKSVMNRSAANDSSVVMDYRKNMNKYKQFQGEFKLYKKALNDIEKSMFVEEFKSINKRIQAEMNQK